MSTEALIVLGLFGFHLYDSLVLLAPREMILICSSNRFALASPYPHVVLRGRIPYLPPPWMPYRTLFRLSWADDVPDAAAQSLDDAQAHARPLRPLGVLVSMLAVLLLIGLPCVAFTVGIGPMFLAGIVAAYGLIVAMLAVVHVRRDVLGLTNRDVASLAFDALACPPFAINLVRKLGLRQSLRIDPLEVATTKLARADAAPLWRSIRRRLDDELLLVQDDHERAARLRTFAADLEGKMA